MLKYGFKRKWLVVLLGLIIYFLNGGSARMASILFLEAMDRYNINRSQASLPFTFCYAVRNICGPGTGYLGDRFGLRLITVLGGLISSIAVSACFFAENEIVFAILWAGVYGIGFSMGTILLPQILNQHFHNRVATVNGIILSGECLAGFLLPMFVNKLLEMYGMSGCLLILGVFMSHSIPLAMLLWPPRRQNASNCYENYEGSSKSKPCLKSNGNSCETDMVQLNTNGLKSSEIIDIHTVKTDSDIYRCDRLIQDITKPNHRTIVDSHERYNSSHGLESSRKSLHTIFSGELVDPNLEMKPKATKYSVCKTSDKNSINKSIHQTPFSSNKYSTFRVLWDPTFILIAFAQSSTVYMYVFIVTIANDIGRDMGVEPYKESFPIMTFAVLDAIGRFCLGLIPDRGYFSNIQFLTVSFTILGVFLVVPIFATGFEVLIVSFSIYGSLIGGIFAACVGVCKDFVEKDCLTIALSSRFIFVAPMSFTQSSFIGLSREKFGNYNGVLILLSILCGLCTLINLLIPIIAKRKCRK